MTPAELIKSCLGSRVSTLSLSPLSSQMKLYPVPITSFLVKTTAELTKICLGSRVSTLSLSPLSSQMKLYPVPITSFLVKTTAELTKICRIDKDLSRFSSVDTVIVATVKSKETILCADNQLPRDETCRTDEDLSRFSSVDTVLNVDSCHCRHCRVKGNYPLCR